MTETLPLPSGLGTRGKRFWRATVTQFDLSTAEVEILTEVVRTITILDGLAAAVTRDGLLTVGSTGQPVAHPALGELRGNRALLHRLLSSLALPDDAGEVLVSVQSTRARRAAQSRWRNHVKDPGRRTPGTTA